MTDSVTESVTDSMTDAMTDAMTGKVAVKRETLNVPQVMPVMMKKRIHA